MTAPRYAVRADALERGVPKDPSLDDQILVPPADDMEAVRFTESVWAWAAEARSRCEDERAAAAVECLEGLSADGGALVDVAPEDEFCSRAG